jgi:hypothetical protein
MAMKNFSLAMAAASATLLLAVPARAEPLFIDFGVTGIGGAPSYSGANLQTSTSFDFGGSLIVVNQVGAGDQSGLSTVAPNNTVTLTSVVTYGPGNSGLLSSPLVEMWSNALGTFTETLTSFSAVRTGTDSITLDLSGTLVGPGGISEAVLAILSANQSGGANKAISWALTDNSVDPAPIPATLPLFATGLGALALLGWRRKRSARSVAV